MKFQIIKDLNKAIVLLVVISSVVSCSMDDIYSCNEDANQWVKINLTEIRQMSSADFLEIGDIVYQRAAFNAFTPNQRQALWIEKLENVLKLDWNEKESQFIKSLLEFVKTNSFIFSNERDQKTFEKIEIELYRLSAFAFEELKWDFQLFYGIIGTPHKLNNNKEIELFLKTSPTIKTRAEKDCDCNASFIWDPGSSAGWFACSILFNKCKTDSGCKPTTWGCGEFWGYGCNGTCVPKN